jgi:superfamily II DNA or RNA helicase
VEQTRTQFEQLWARPDVAPLSEAFIAGYRREYLALQRSQVPSAPLPDAPAMPNAAQLEALARLTDLRAQNLKRAAIVAATGVGKTLLAAFDVRRIAARSVLYVSHRLEHLLQAERAFARVLGSSRSLGVVGGGRDEPKADVVFATIASLRQRPELLRRRWDYLVVDEFHHVEAKSYEVLRPLRERAFLLGLTATPERQDGHDVLEWCDWNVAYEVRLPEAIERGWLLPFHYFGIADTTVDFADFPWRKIHEIEDVLSVRTRAELILKTALEHGFDGNKRVTVGFCAGRRHAKYMADTFKEFGQHAAYLSGDDPVEEREAVYARLSDLDDPLSWLFVSDILNEGVDLPAINSVLFLRPTESATLFLQQLGRGLRLFPGTEVLTVLDFVGHHRSSWLTLQALDSPAAGGRRVEVANGVKIRPPAGCEVVLQRRTREILAKVKRFTSKKEECAEAYKRVREELGRPLLPIDIWGRTDVPTAREFRGAFGSWFNCQKACGDTPAWAVDLRPDHPAVSFLRQAEIDWQKPRIYAYALLWGLCAKPDDPAQGYEEFFARWPHLRVEYATLGPKTWDAVREKLGPSLSERVTEEDLLVAGDSERLASQLANEQLAPSIVHLLGDELVKEVEGRLLYTVNSDYRLRHGGVLRTPADLKLYGRYTRPEIIQHFGKQYDPAIHNAGILWFENEGVIIVKLDTSGAKTEHQYTNHFIDRSTFLWTSQNQMAPTNAAGKRVLEHKAGGRRLHLFVKEGSHDLSVYVGLATVRGFKGSSPMSVTLQLGAVPGQVFAELIEDPEESETGK